MSARDWGFIGSGSYNCLCTVQHITGTNELLITIAAPYQKVQSPSLNDYCLKIAVCVYTFLITIVLLFIFKSTFPKQLF